MPLDESSIFPCILWDMESQGNMVSSPPVNFLNISIHGKYGMSYFMNTETQGNHEIYTQVILHIIFQGDAVCIIQSVHSE